MTLIVLYLWWLTIVSTELQCAEPVFLTWWLGFLAENSKQLSDEQIHQLQAIGFNGMARPPLPWTSRLLCQRKRCLTSTMHLTQWRQWHSLWAIPTFPCFVRLHWKYYDTLAGCPRINRNHCCQTQLVSQWLRPGCQHLQRCLKTHFVVSTLLLKKTSSSWAWVPTRFTNVRRSSWRPKEGIPWKALARHAGVRWWWFHYISKQFNHVQWWCLRW